MAAQKHLFAAAALLHLFDQQPAYFYARLYVENLPKTCDHMRCQRCPQE